MLNRNKIDSLINYENSNPSIVSRQTGINYQTLKSKLKSGSWLAEDIEKLAIYFNKPISYFFDSNEISLEESRASYNCKSCIEKQQEIDKLSRKVIEIQEKYSNCLEELLGKKENRAKNSA